MKNFLYRFSAIAIFYFFISCSKIALGPDKPLNEPISVDLLKERFRTVQEVSSRRRASARESGKREQKMPVTALWDETKAYPSTTGDGLIVVPVFFEKDVSFAGTSYRQMVYYRDKQSGEIKGFIVEKIFDESYLAEYKGLGNNTRKAFSGAIIYYDEEGSYLGGQSYKNGITRGQAIVSLDGSVMKSPNQRNAKMFYGDCEILSVHLNCPQRPAMLGGGGDGYVPLDAAQLNSLIQICTSVTLELGNCVSDGSGGDGTTPGGGTPTNSQYTPPAGYTPSVAAPYAGGPSGYGTPNGYYLDDEQMLAIEIIGRNVQQITLEERQLLRSQAWLSYVIQGIVAETGNSELDVVRQTYSIWADIDPETIKQQFENIKNASQQNVADAITALAEYTHTLYERLAPIANAHPRYINVINGALTVAKRPIHLATDYNPQTMGWFNIFAIWALELGTQPRYNFTQSSNSLIDLRTQEGVNNARQAAIADARNNVFNVDRSRAWTYGQTQFYNNLANVITCVIGGHIVDYKVTDLGNHQASVSFHINNVTGWESATRLRKAAYPNGPHQGVIDDKPRGTGIQLGGNLIEDWTWSEIINY